MISLAKVKSWLGVTDTSTDTLLTDLEARVATTVGNSIDLWLGTPRDVSEVLDGGQDAVWLRAYPIGGAVTVSTRGNLSQAWTELTAEEFEIDRRELIIVSGQWPPGRRTVKADYEEGYAVDAGPGDIAQVILELIAREYEGRGNSRTIREKLGPLEVEYRPLEDMPDPMSGLTHYRRFRIGG